MLRNFYLGEMSNIDEVIEKLDKSFTPHVNTKPRAKIDPHQIEWRGHLVKMGSGKSLWNNRGYAVSALKNHMDSQGYYNREDDYNKVIEILIERGLLKFVRVGEK